MSIIDSLITDRTQFDCEYVRELAARLYSSETTAEERAAWLSGLKGAYSYPDYNRVGEACNYVYELLVEAGIDASTYTRQKTNWTYSDTPTPEQMDAYLAGLQVVRDACAPDMPLPSSVATMGYPGANNIEQMLVIAVEAPRKITAGWWYSGEFEAGEN